MDDLLDLMVKHSFQRNHMNATNEKFRESFVIKSGIENINLK